VVIALSGLGAASGPASAREGWDDTGLWGDLLAAHGRDGGLDYEGLAADSPRLDQYLQSVSAADSAAMERDRQLAFWINAYNAVVARFVLDRYPGISSVREVGDFFDGQTFVVAGRQMTLDEVESRARDLGDPRAHFAVVCASTSCPDLRAEAYSGERIEAQLEEQTRAFLADPEKGLRFDAGAGVLYLSSIFKWYAGDFTGGSTVVAFFSRSKIIDWLLPHLPAELAAVIEKAEPSVRYLDYDWSLNDR
jgi:hypothetical protein